MDEPNISPTSNPTADIYAPRAYTLSGKIMLAAVLTLFGVVLILLLLHLYFRLFLLRHRRTRLQPPAVTPTVAFPSLGPHRLDPAVLASIPVFSFEEDSGECAVCLSEFEREERGRRLPGCGHCFHVECVDMWFGSHSSCPMCRSSVEAAAREEDGGERVEAKALGRWGWGFWFRRGGEVETGEGQV